MQQKKLAIVSTHPIQYNAPFFSLLNSRGKVYPKVFYTWPQAKEIVADKGFGHDIKWDIPLLTGYDYEFVDNVASKPGNKSFFGIRSKQLVSRIEAFKPDAILVFGWNFKSHLDVLRHFKGKVPVWFRGDSHLLDERPGLKTLGRRLFLRWVYAYIDKAFYVGIKNKAYHLKHRLKEDQLVFAPHAVDNERFMDNRERSYEEKALAMRKELDYNADDLVVLFAGKFERKKNPMLLVNAFNSILKANGNLKLLLVGSGQMETELKNAAKGNANIQFLAFQNQSVMPVIYRVGDVLCLPSKGPRENWGLAVNESLACGRPVIVSRLAGCSSDIVINDTIGWMLNDLDGVKEVSQIINKVDSTIVNDDSARNQRTTFIKSWSLESFCESIEKTFEGKMKKRIALVVSHPIQHFCPQYESFAQYEQIDFKVFFASTLGYKKYYDANFKREVSWSNLQLDKFEHIFLNGDLKLESGRDIDAPNLDKELEAFSPDVVIIYGYFQQLQRRAYRWANANNVPLAYISDSELRHRKNGLMAFVKSLFIRRYFSKIQYFLSVGDANETFYKNYGVSAKKFIRMHFPIDIKHYQESYLKRTSLRDSIRRQYGIDNAEIVLLVVGKLVPWKNQDHLIAAIRLLEHDGIFLTLFILGSGEMLDSLKDKAKDVNKSKIHFPGFVNVDLLSSYYASADIYVHPASVEPHSIAVSEAIYMGLPVIISDRCGSYGETDDVQEGINGFIYEFGDINALTDQIKKFVFNENLRRQFGEHSHKIATQFQEKAHRGVLDRLIPHLNES